jgi:hypothetical protein
MSEEENMPSNWYVSLEYERKTINMVTVPIRPTT